MKKIFDAGKKIIFHEKKFFTKKIFDVTNKTLGPTNYLWIKYIIIAGKYCGKK